MPAHPCSPYRLVYQVEVLLVGTECLLKKPLLHGGPDVRTYQRKSQAWGQDGADVQTTVLPKAAITKHDHVSNILLSPLLASSATALTKPQRVGPS